MFKQQYKCDKCNKIEWYKPNEVPDKCECEEFTYPMWFRNHISGSIIKFTSLNKGEVVFLGENSMYTLGQKVSYSSYTDRYMGTDRRP